MFLPLKLKLVHKILPLSIKKINLKDCFIDKEITYILDMLSVLPLKTEIRNQKYLLLIKV